MKSIFTKPVRYLEKSSRVVIQHDGDAYYIGDGFSALKVPAALFPEITALCGLFRECPDGEGVDIHPGSMEAAPTKTPVKFSEFFTHDGAKPLTVTHLSLDTIRGRKHRVLDLFAGELLVALDHEIVKAYADFAGGEAVTVGKYHPVLFGEGPMGCEFLVMPVRLDEKTLATFRQFAAAVPQQ